MPLLYELQILAVYAALLGLFFVALSILTIRARGTAQVGLGDGGDEVLLRRIRAHANFAEYAPIALVLIAGAAIAGAPVFFVHASAASLVIGRIVHAYALCCADGRLRVVGMTITFAVILAASGHILWSTLI